MLRLGIHTENLLGLVDWYFVDWKHWCLRSWLGSWWYACGGGESYGVTLILQSSLVADHNAGFIRKYWWFAASKLYWWGQTFIWFYNSIQHTLLHHGLFLLQAPLWFWPFEHRRLLGLGTFITVRSVPWFTCYLWKHCGKWWKFCFQNEESALPLLLYLYFVYLGFFRYLIAWNA